MSGSRGADSFIEKQHAWLQGLGKVHGYLPASRIHFSSLVSLRFRKVFGFVPILGSKLSLIKTLILGWFHLISGRIERFQDAEPGTWNPEKRTRVPSAAPAFTQRNVLW